MSLRSLIPFSMFLVSVIILSCNHVYKEYDKASFPGYSWSAGQEIRFTPEIKDIEKKYSIIIGIRHLYAIPQNSLNINVRSVSPSGKETTSQYTVTVRDGRGQATGNCAGDICDLETTVEETVIFAEPGVYQYFISHRSQSKIPGIMEVGLVIDEND
jgi:gliding motility-associated lipoprotein GldH